MADWKLLQDLCEIRGISGREEAVRERIIEEIRPYAPYRVDRLGNLIVEKAGKKRAKNRVMLDAHMDEVGLIVTAIDGDGALHFAKVGSINDSVLAGIPVLVGDSAIPGVIGVKPIHLCKPDERAEAVGSDKLVIDIGAQSREEAEKIIFPGDMVTFVSPFWMEDGKVRAKALDDRAGCAQLVEMIRAEQEYDLVFSFSVQEEVGGRGAAAAAYTIHPDAAIAVECTSAGDLAGVPEEKCCTRVGKGAALSFMDKSTIYDVPYYRLAQRLAEENGIALQVKQMIAGGNNAGVIHKSAGGVRTAALSVPCRYLHAPISMIATEDYEAEQAMLTKLAAAMAAGEEEI